MRALAGKIMGKRRDARERMERVLKAASELGYQPCEFAKSLRKGKTNTIGLVVGSITNRYFSALVEIVMDEAERNGYRMILELTRWDAEKYNLCLEHLLRLRVDGIFWSGGNFPRNGRSLMRGVIWMYPPSCSIIMIPEFPQFAAADVFAQLVQHPL